MSKKKLENDAETVVRRYSDMIYGIALSRLGVKEDAEDVMQETFLAYFRKKKTFADEEHRKAWLIRTVLNCSRHAYGRRKKSPQTVPLDAIEIPVRFKTEEESKVFKAVTALPDTLKDVIWLHYFEDMPAGKIAETLRIRESAVYVRLSRARTKLKEMLEGETES